MADSAYLERGGMFRQTVAARTESLELRRGEIQEGGRGLDNDGSRESLIVGCGQDQFRRNGMTIVVKVFVLGPRSEMDGGRPSFDGFTDQT